MQYRGCLLVEISQRYPSGEAREPLGHGLPLLSRIFQSRYEAFDRTVLNVHFEVLPSPMRNQPFQGIAVWKSLAIVSR
jgi:hypothetical protein